MIARKTRYTATTLIIKTLTRYIHSTSPATQPLHGEVRHHTCRPREPLAVLLRPWVLALNSVLELTQGRYAAKSQRIKTVPRFLARRDWIPARSSAAPPM